MEERVFGFKPSIIDGTERIFEGNEKIELPEKYTYKAYLTKVLDQGSDSICVPCAVSAYLNWKENLRNGYIKDNKISLYDIYESRTNDGDGMTYKDAFHYLRHNGVKSKNSAIGSSTTLWFSFVGIVTSVASLLVNIIRN